MRRYDDPVEVRKGMVGGTEGPEQFLWRGRLWKVCDVLAHWVETGPWWQSSGVHAVLGWQESEGPDGPGEPDGPGAVAVDLAPEREVWRVEAARGRAAAHPANRTANGAAAGSAAGSAAEAAAGGRGVFDLVFDWAQGSWQLTCCVD